MLGGLRYLIPPWILVFWNVECGIWVWMDSYSSLQILGTLCVAFTSSPSCPLTEHFSQTHREHKKETKRTDFLDPHSPVLFFLRSAPTLSTEGRVICCSRSHLPLSIPLSSVTSNKISKRVDFSEIDVVIGVVLGGLLE